MKEFKIGVIAVADDPFGWKFAPVNALRKYRDYELDISGYFRFIAFASSVRTNFKTMLSMLMIDITIIYS